MEEAKRIGKMYTWICLFAIYKTSQSHLEVTDTL